MNSERLGAWWRHWWPGVAAMAVLAAMFAAPPASGPGSPGGTVRDYLTAIQRGDVDRALSMAGWTPSGEPARFLTEPEDQDWRIAELSTRWRDSGSGADVTVTIDNGRSTGTGMFRLGQAAGGWRIADPFVRVRFGGSPLEYTNVATVVGEYGPEVEGREYLLFPGGHMFYPTAPDAVDVTTGPRLLLPGTGTVTIRPEAVALTATGETAAREAVRAFIDDCAARAESTTVEGCPFTAGYGLSALIGARQAEDESVDWRVVDYPEVSFTAEPDGPITVLDDQVGVIELSGKDEDGRSFTVDCQIQAHWLTLTVQADGRFTVTHLAANTEQSWRPGDFPDPSVNTCVG